MELTSIATLLGNAKAAIELAKVIKDSSTTLDQAETKLKLAELISALADVKVQAAEVQQELLDAQAQVRALEAQAAERAALEWRQPAYWRKSEDGKTETPYCQPCNDKEGRLAVLHVIDPGEYHCHACGKTFRTPEALARIRHETDAAMERAGRGFSF